MEKFVFEGLVGWTAMIVGVYYGSPWLALAGFIFTITRRVPENG